MDYYLEYQRNIYIILIYRIIFLYLMKGVHHLHDLLIFTLLITVSGFNNLRILGIVLRVWYLC